MRSRLPGGLRTRLLLALLLTSLATLGVAATVLLLRPLPERLREQSAVNLRAAVLASRPALEDAVRRRIEDEFAIPSAAEELRQRTDGRVVVEDPVLPGEVLYDTSDDASTRGVTVVALQTLRTGATTTAHRRRLRADRRPAVRPRTA